MNQDATKNAEEVAEEANEALDQALQENEAERRERQGRVRRNCSQIRALLKEEQYFWVQQLDGVADNYPYKTILDIFVRVNSGGTKLDAGDLMFAVMKEGWADIEENVEEVAELLSDGKLDFDKSFVLKCLVLAHGRDAELTPEKFSDNQGKTLLSEIEAKWTDAEAAFQQLRDFIEHDLRLLSSSVVRSYGSLIPLFDYLYHHQKPNHENRIRMRAYYYKAQLFNWFARGTDGTLNTIHRILSKATDDDFPLAQITAHFATRGTGELTMHHLEQARPRTILLNILYIETFSASPFDVRFKGNEPHADHIYPRSPLSTSLSYLRSKSTISVTFGLSAPPTTSENVPNLLMRTSPDSKRQACPSSGTSCSRSTATTPQGSNSTLKPIGTSATDDATRYSASSRGSSTSRKNNQRKGTRPQ